MYIERVRPYPYVVHIHTLCSAFDMIKLKLHCKHAKCTDMGDVTSRGEPSLYIYIATVATYNSIFQVHD